MKLILVHLASLAVMFHMAFGCHWHHGLGAADACNHQSSLSACSHVSDIEHGLGSDDDHGDHDHEHHHDNHDTPLTLALDIDGADHDHDHHSCCRDDGCSLIKVVKFKYTPLNFVTRYLSGAEDLAILKSASASFPVDPSPDCRLYAPSVRAHLLLGVQLI